MRKALLVSALLLVGCTHHIRVENPFYRPTDVHRRWVHGWLFNLIGSYANTTEMCGNRPVAVVDTKKSFGNHLISWLTLGIYTPMHLTVVCGEPTQGGYPGGPGMMQPHYQPGYQGAPAYQPPVYQPPVYQPAPAYQPQQGYPQPVYTTPPPGYR